MGKTLRIMISLKNTYRVNSILYGLKQLPLIKKLLPANIYGVRGFKIFANILSAFSELFFAFMGKILFFAVMIAAVTGLGIYQKVPQGQLFVHLFFFLTLAGALLNNDLLPQGMERYYAVILMRMDARKYVLANYGYFLLKFLAGYLIFGTLIGRMCGVELVYGLLFPIFAIAVKCIWSAVYLRLSRKTGIPGGSRKNGKYVGVAALVLLAAGYGLPLAGLLLPFWGFALATGAAVWLGVWSFLKIQRFKDYRPLYQKVLAEFVKQIDQIDNIGERTISSNAISVDKTAQSSRSGFEYLNELFVKRHKKILWRAAGRVAVVSLVVVLLLVGVCIWMPEGKESLNQVMLNYLPYFVFIMYAVNRGATFTQALFFNCDHSLLTYSFYKEPSHVLKLFRIRLREIIKVNLLPALVIGAGMPLILFMSGGTEQWTNYIVLFVSITSLSVFFSVHYLTMYYLLQPYHMGTETKSGPYQAVMSGTYLVCFLMMQLKLPTLLFGGLAIVFCVMYCVVACILVYRFAPKTFRLRI